MIFKNAQIISPEDNLDGIFDVEIEDGIITNIAKNIAKNTDIIDLTGKTITPIFIEMHAHFREPGFEEKETIETGCDSALAGGYGAVCVMANTNPVNDNEKTLSFILNKSKNAPVKVLPICAITKDLAGKEINDLISLKNLGAIAFSDDGRPIEDMNILMQAMRIAKEHDLLLISHAEDSSIHDRHKVSEPIAVARELELVREVGCKYHFAHISTKRALELIRQAKQDGLKVTCETAPHYFSLSKADIPMDDARFKVNPPLREAEDVKAVIEALIDGTIDVIATDHAPHTMPEKQKCWKEAPMGIVGLETAFFLSYTYLVGQGHLDLAQLVQKMTINPAKILGLNDFGFLQIGKEASFNVIDEKGGFSVKGNDFKSKCKVTPFEGKMLTGKVVQTIIKGKLYDRNI